MTPSPIQPTDQLALGARSLLSSSAIHALVLGCLAWTSSSDLPGPVGGEVRARRGTPLRIEFAMVEAQPTDAPFEEELREEEPLAFDSAPAENESAALESFDVRLPEWDEYDGVEEMSSPKSRAALKPAPMFVDHLEVPRTMVFASLRETPEELPEPEIVAVEGKSELETQDEFASADVPSPESEEPPAEAPGEADVLPSILKAPAPNYPRRAIRLEQEGAVTCLILVDAKGRVKKVTVAESSGYELLDDAAVAAVETWQFEPGSIAGVPTEREVRHLVRFELTIR